MGIRNEFDIDDFREEADKIGINKYDIYERVKTDKIQKFRSSLNNPRRLTDRDKLEITFLVLGIFMIGFVLPPLYYNSNTAYIHVLILGLVDLIISQLIPRRIFEDDTRIEAEF